MAVVYNDIPSLSTWKSDSSVRLAIRTNDVALTRVDELMDAFNRAPDAGARIYIACDLFFTLDYWLKIFKSNQKMEKGREPAVMALYKVVVDKLGRAFGAYLGAQGGVVTPNNLPTVLEMFFGRTMGSHGSDLDLRQDCAQYLSRAEVRKYRLAFKDGKAYQFPWWDPKAKANSAIVLADSSHAYNSAVFGGGARVNWGGFAMSMGRDIYMALHHCTKDFGEQGNFYHSSYLGGEPVMCAGTMLIQNGVIRGVSTDSGHYRPDNTHVVNLLQALRMRGVNLASVQVQDFQAIFQGNGDAFLAANGNWAAMAQRHQLNLQHIDARRLHEADFGDAIKQLWQQGLQKGFYTDNMPGRIYFASHVLPGKSYDGHSLQGLNFLYALDALAKAISRGTDPTTDWNAWCIESWRTFLKGDTITKRNGMPNKRSTIPYFADWLMKLPSFNGWSKPNVITWTEKVFKETNHRFDA